MHLLRFDVEALGGRRLFVEVARASPLRLALVRREVLLDEEALVLVAVGLALFAHALVVLLPLPDRQVDDASVHRTRGIIPGKLNGRLNQTRCGTCREKRRSETSKRKQNGHEHNRQSLDFFCVDTEHSCTDVQNTRGDNPHISRNQQQKIQPQTKADQRANQKRRFFKGESSARGLVLVPGSTERTEPSVNLNRVDMLCTQMCGWENNRRTTQCSSANVFFMAKQRMR